MKLRTKEEWKLIQDNISSLCWTAMLFVFEIGVFGFMCRLVWEFVSGRYKP